MNTGVEMAEQICENDSSQPDCKTVAYKVAMTRKDFNMPAAPVLDMTDVYAQQWVSINPIKDLQNKGPMDMCAVKMMHWNIEEPINSM